MLSLKRHFSRFHAADPTRLHAAAHSHHYWPDVALAAQNEAWLDAARLVDHKWDKIFGEIVPRAQAHVARVLALPDPSTVVFGPNTHGFLVRLFSSLPPPVRILATDGEFHSFARQSLRWQEAGLAVVDRVPVEPFDSFADRFATTLAEDRFDLVYVSQVFFNSGYAWPGLERLATAASAVVVVDGYHGFMALPTSLRGLAARVFYLAGGYKYAMSGEGACFLHCPPGALPRPVDTGWFAGFGALERSALEVGYGSDGSRFAGATYDPSGLYRFVAVMDWLERERITVTAIHDHVAALERRFLAGLPPASALGRAELVPPEPLPRGHFLTFRTPDAQALHDALAHAAVVTDLRGDRLRLGFGAYHEASDIDELLRRLARAAP